MLLGLGVYLAPNASAFIFVTPAPSFPDTVTVGQTFPAALGINNSSTPPESTTNPSLTISAIDLYPACTTTSVDCTGGTAQFISFLLVLTTQPSVSMVENLLLSSFTALCVGFIAYALLTGYDQIKLRSRESSEADYEMSDPWS